MKNYLYKFKFISGYYEDYFYKQLCAENMKDALNKIFVKFSGMDENKASEYLKNKLGVFWEENDFWEKMVMPIFSYDDMEAYCLDDVKEIPFDLDRI